MSAGGAIKCKDFKKTFSWFPPGNIWNFEPNVKTGAYCSWRGFKHSSKWRWNSYVIIKQKNLGEILRCNGKKSTFWTFFCSAPGGKGKTGGVLLAPAARTSWIVPWDACRQTRPWRQGVWARMGLRANLAYWKKTKSKVIREKNLISIFGQKKKLPKITDAEKIPDIQITVGITASHRVNSHILWFLPPSQGRYGRDNIGRAEEGAVGEKLNRTKKGGHISEDKNVTVWHVKWMNWNDGRKTNSTHMMGKEK